MGHAGLIPTAFAQAATGELTPGEGLDQADDEVRRIFQKWQEGAKMRTHGAYVFIEPLQVQIQGGNRGHKRSSEYLRIAPALAQDGRRCGTGRWSSPQHDQSGACESAAEDAEDFAVEAFRTKL
jgi:hypothetical protein